MNKNLPLRPLPWAALVLGSASGPLLARTPALPLTSLLNPYSAGFPVSPKKLRGQLWGSCLPRGDEAWAPPWAGEGQDALGAQDVGGKGEGPLSSVPVQIPLLALSRMQLRFAPMLAASWLPLGNQFPAQHEEKEPLSLAGLALYLRRAPGQLLACRMRPWGGHPAWSGAPGGSVSYLHWPLLLGHCPGTCS